MFNNPTRYFVHCVVFSVDSYEISPASCDLQVSNSLYAYRNLLLAAAYIIKFTELLNVIRIEPKLLA